MRVGSYSNFVQCFSVRYIFISSSLTLALPYIVRFNALSLLTYPSTIPFEKLCFNALLTASKSISKPFANVLNPLNVECKYCLIHSPNIAESRSRINAKNPFVALYNSLNHLYLISFSISLCAHSVIVFPCMCRSTSIAKTVGVYIGKIGAGGFIPFFNRTLFENRAQIDSCALRDISTKPWYG